MNTDYPKPDVERPKRTAKERRMMFNLEARSHANTLLDLAAGYRRIHDGKVIPDAMEKAAKFLWELTK